MWDPRFAFSACQFFTGHSRSNFVVRARAASSAFGEVSKRGSVLCSRFIFGIGINFVVASCTFYPL